MLDNLLAGDFLRPVPAIFVVILTLLIALLAGLATSWASGIFRSVLVYLFFICVLIILCLIAYRVGFWLPLVVQEAAVVMTLFGAGLIYYTIEGRQKAYIKSAFKQYLSHTVIEELIQNPERLKLGDERRMLSIFFSALEGFTSLSEGLDPEALALFYRGEFAEAKKIFSAIAAEDAVAKAYVTKCDNLIARPPENWQGVWVITTK